MKNGNKEATSFARDYSTFGAVIPDNIGKRSSRRFAGTVFAGFKGVVQLLAGINPTACFLREIQPLGNAVGYRCVHDDFKATLLTSFVSEAFKGRD